MITIFDHFKRLAVADYVKKQILFLFLKISVFKLRGHFNSFLLLLVPNSVIRFIFLL
jgi:hypothetical protein